MLVCLRLRLQRNLQELISRFFVRFYVLFSSIYSNSATLIFAAAQFVGATQSQAVAIVQHITGHVRMAQSL